jgi:hypothetical protein
VALGEAPQPAGLAAAEAIARSRAEPGEAGLSVMKAAMARKADTVAAVVRARGCTWVLPTCTRDGREHVRPARPRGADVSRLNLTLTRAVNTPNSPTNPARPRPPGRSWWSCSSPRS